MKKAASKRLPHGTTSNLVLAWLWHLHMQAGEPKPVSRTALVTATGLPDTTVDDRLRVLSKGGGPVLNVGRGLYAPRHHKGNTSLNKHGREAESPGKRHPKVFWGEEVVLLEEWLSIKEYLQRHEKLPNLDDKALETLPDEAAQDNLPERPRLVLPFMPRHGEATVCDGEGYQYQVKKL